ncbi:hypothetical protein L3i22_049650 [Actinoplanes sp. L3-i22]|nr:hypothetical protein L3i22_049650 [Actinoplanes sp. L3-i22]
MADIIAVGSGSWGWEWRRDVGDLPHWADSIGWISETYGTGAPRSDHRGAPAAQDTAQVSAGVAGVPAASSPKVVLAPGATEPL